MDPRPHRRPIIFQQIQDVADGSNLRLTLRSDRPDSIAAVGRLSGTRGETRWSLEDILAGGATTTLQGPGEFHLDVVVDILAENTSVLFLIDLGRSVQRIERRFKGLGSNHVAVTINVLGPRRRAVDRAFPRMPAESLPSGDVGPFRGGSDAAASVEPVGAGVEAGGAAAAGGGGGEEPPAATPAPPDLTRYANAVLIAGDSDTPLDRRVPLTPGQTVRLRLHIGPLDPESHVRDAKPLPDLPADVWLDVVLASTDFQVGRSLAELGHVPIALGRLFVPGKDGKDTGDREDRYLILYLRAPETPRIAQARVMYYYRNSLVQSHRLEAEITQGRSSRVPAFDLAVDFTLSEQLTDLEHIPDNRRVSIVAGDQADGRYRFVLRSTDTAGAPKDVRAFELKESVLGRLVQQLRTILRNRAPTTQRRSGRELEDDLKAIAPLGSQLYTALAGQDYVLDLLAEAYEDPGRNVIQVCRPNTASFTIPWGLIYEIPLGDQAVRDGKLTVCPLVSNWRNGSLIDDASHRQCPAAPRGHEENTLCPFGFWGYRYTIEQLAAARTPERRIRLPNPLSMVTGETRYNVNQRRLDDHIDQLRAILRTPHPDATVARGATTTDLRRLLGTDVPLVYFFCHGERLRPGEADTVLAVGKRETMSARDFIGWVTGWRLRSGRRVWDIVRPLVLINACHSVEVNPETLSSYVDAFVGAANAAGVIGTEVRVEESQAMTFAEEFFRSFAAGKPLDEAMRIARFKFLQDGNLLGLTYNAFAWADLTLEAA